MRVPVIAAFLCWLLLLSAAADAGSDRRAILIRLLARNPGPQAWKRTPGVSSWIPVNQGERLGEGDILKTAAGSRVELEFENGIAVHLLTGAEIQLRSQGLPGTGIVLMSGKLFLRTAGASLHVITRSAVATARSSELMVELSALGTRVASIHGSVKVHGELGEPVHEIVAVEPGQQTVVPMQGPAPSAQAVDMQQLFVEAGVLADRAASAVPPVIAGEPAAPTATSPIPVALRVPEGSPTSSVAPVPMTATSEPVPASPSPAAVPPAVVSFPRPAAESAPDIPREARQALPVPLLATEPPSVFSPAPAIPSTGTSPLPAGASPWVALASPAAPPATPSLQPGASSVPPIQASGSPSPQESEAGGPSPAPAVVPPVAEPSSSATPTPVRPSPEVAPSPTPLPATSPAVQPPHMPATAPPLLLPTNPPTPEIAPGLFARMIIVKREHRLYFYDPEGRLRKVYKVGLGTPWTPTPSGFRAVGEKIPNPTGVAWALWPSSRGRAFGNRLLALYWFDPIHKRRTAKSKQELHGTDVRHSVGANYSHGCMRMFNEDIEEVYQSVRIGDILLVKD